MAHIQNADAGQQQPNQLCKIDDHGQPMPEQQFHQEQQLLLPNPGAAGNLLQNHSEQDQQGGDGQNSNDQASITRRLLLDDEKRRLMFMQAHQQRNAMMMPAAQYAIQPQAYAMAPNQAMQFQAMNSRFMVPQSFNPAMQMNPQMYFQGPHGVQQQQGQMQPGHVMMPQMMMGPSQMMMTPNPAMMMPMQGQFDPTTGSFFAPVMQHSIPLENPENLKELDDRGKRSPSPEMPIRPLSAYNFFFSDEREKILSEDKDDSAPEEDAETKKKRLLGQHILKDRTKRRPHRKTHGTIGFTSLSKLIGTRWRALSDENKQYYKDIAAMDMDRYQKDVAEYNNERLSKRARR